jgi:transposase-like protein
MPKAYFEEFRRDAVAMARRKEASMRQIAKDIGISQPSLHRWVRRAEIEDDLRERMTLAEEAEIPCCQSATGCSSRRTRSFAEPPSTWARASTQNDVPAGLRANRGLVGGNPEGWKTIRRRGSAWSGRSGNCVGPARAGNQRAQGDSSSPN